MKIFDNLFDDQSFKFINDAFHDSLKKPWEINKYLWQPYLTESYDGFVLMQHVSDPVKRLVNDAIKDHVQFNEQPGIMFYMWNEGSGINWHTDDHVEKACTIYLNDWPLERGGQFVYKEDDTDKIIPIKKNRIVINDDSTEHKVTRVRKSRDIRYTLQVFGK